MTDTVQISDEADLVAAVAAAAGDGVALDVAGRGTKRDIGRPVAAGRRLDLSGFSGVTLYEPEELVFTARPGTPLRDIEAMLGQHRQMLAFEPMDSGPLMGGAAGDGTLGGLFACNLSGPRRLSHGAVRDHALGIRAVSGRGEVFKSGGRVMKNVTGYDLPRMLAGAFGTLAVMSEITLKVLPMPETEETLLVFGLDPVSAAKAMSAAMGSSCEVSGAATLPGAIASRRDEVPGAAAVVAFRLEGFAPSVRARRAMMVSVMTPFGGVEVLEETASRSFWAMVRDALPFAGTGERAVWRMSTAPMAGPVLARALADSLGAEVFCDWAGGLVWALMPDEAAQAEAVRAALAPHGGHATLVRAAPSERMGDVFQPLEANLAALTARVKASFDPRGILNPGRMHAGL